MRGSFWARWTSVNVVAVFLSLAEGGLVGFAVPKS
jgi:hypothetical protein